MINLRAVRPSLTEVERNPIQQALDNYTDMERSLTEFEARCRDLSIQNTAMTSEIGMLRETLERVDNDRIRLQAISSTLLGRLMGIKDCIEGAVRDSIKNGIEAADKQDVALEQAGAEVREVLQRVRQEPLPEVAGALGVIPDPRHGTTTTVPPNGYPVSNGN